MPYLRRIKPYMIHKGTFCSIKAVKYEEDVPGATDCLNNKPFLYLDASRIDDHAYKTSTLIERNPNKNTGDHLNCSKQSLTDRELNKVRKP